jgi:hypothetical protein
MRRLGLMAVVVAAALAGAVVAKLHSRWAAMCANVPCSSLQTRLGVIGQMIAARPRGPTYLVIGDSLTEIGRWPAMCGREPVAAGISGARWASLRGQGVAAVGGSAEEFWARQCAAEFEPRLTRGNAAIICVNLAAGIQSELGQGRTPHAVE